MFARPTHWKLKALMQKAVAWLPKPISYEAYFQLQRHFGGLKKPYNPLSIFKTGVAILKKIKSLGCNINGKKFFEVGTGRVPILPVAFWLGGGSTITIDLNPYMRNELIEDMLFFVSKEEIQIKSIFGDFLDEKRFDLLLDYGNSKMVNKDDFLKTCQIEYLAPGDAAKVRLNENSVNYHISHAVYEHIPLNILFDILSEGNRITTTDGLFVNIIDYADHFAQMDQNISAINFLKYSDKDWDKWAGNRFMYMNRARHDDFIELFKSVGHDFVETVTYKDRNIQELLHGGALILDDRFNKKEDEILSITSAWFITKKS